MAGVGFVKVGRVAPVAARRLRQRDRAQRDHRGGQVYPEGAVVAGVRHELALVKERVVVVAGVLGPDAQVAELVHAGQALLRGTPRILAVSGVEVCRLPLRFLQIDAVEGVLGLPHLFARAAFTVDAGDRRHKGRRGFRVQPVHPAVSPCAGALPFESARIARIAPFARQILRPAVEKIRRGRLPLVPALFEQVALFMALVDRLIEGIVVHRRAHDRIYLSEQQEALDLLHLHILPKRIHKRHRIRHPEGVFTGDRCKEVAREISDDAVKHTTEIPGVNLVILFYIIDIIYERLLVLLCHISTVDTAANVTE